MLKFGNNEKEDGHSAPKVGVKSYMVGDYISVDKENPNAFTHIKMQDMTKILEEEIKERENA